MQTTTLMGFLLVAFALPGLLAGLALLLGKWTPPLKSADPARARKVLGLALVSGDALLLAAGVVLAFTGT